MKWVWSPYGWRQDHDTEYVQPTTLPQVDQTPQVDPTVETTIGDQVNEQEPKPLRPLGPWHEVGVEVPMDGGKITTPKQVQHYQ